VEIGSRPGLSSYRLLGLSFGDWSRQRKDRTLERPRSPLVMIVTLKAVIHDGKI
jgi:hypothetical protein